MGIERTLDQHIGVRIPGGSQVGAPDGRYPKAAEKTMTVRAPEFSLETGVPFAAYIHPSNPTRGAYGGLSFVIFLFWVLASRS